MATRSSTSEFERLLASQCVPEWVDKYLAYNELTSLLVDLREQLCSAGNSSAGASDGAGSTSARDLGRVSAPLFALLASEISAVDEFFQEHLAIIRLHWTQLQPQARAMELSRRDNFHESEAAAWEAKRQELRTGFVELYRYTSMLLNYADLNYAGFANILAEYDAVSQSEIQQVFLEKSVQPLGVYQAVHQSGELARIRQDIERVFADAFFHGKLDDAKRELDNVLAGRRLTKQTVKSAFRLGLYGGMCIPLLLLVLGGIANNQLNHVKYPFAESSFAAFRSVGLPIWLMWMAGANLYVWHKYRVNYEYIFGFAHGHHLTAQNILEAASFTSFIFLLALFLYINNAGATSHILGISPEVYPLLLVAMFVVVIFFPSRSWMYGETRLWLVNVLWRIVRSPFPPVRFPDFYFADQMCSLPLVFIDMEYILCFLTFDYWWEKDNDTESSTHCYSINHHYFKPLLSLMPYWFRFMQCIRRYYATGERMPHLVNAGKYFTSMVASILSAIAGVHETPFYWGPWHCCWLVSIIISALYSYAWDLTQDWGLLKSDAKYPLLRRKLMYRSRWVYYWAMASNLLLRFAWTLSISPSFLGYVRGSGPFNLALGWLEVTRRGQWNFFRMENEHVSNCGKFRAVKEIPLPFEDPETRDARVVAAHVATAAPSNASSAGGTPGIGVRTGTGTMNNAGTRGDAGPRHAASVNPGTSSSVLVELADQPGSARSRNSASDDLTGNLGLDIDLDAISNSSDPLLGRR